MPIFNFPNTALAKHAITFLLLQPLPPQLFSLSSSNPKMRERQIITHFGERRVTPAESIHLTKWTDLDFYFIPFFFLYLREREFLHLKEHIAESFITTDVCAVRIML